MKQKLSRTHDKNTDVKKIIQSGPSIPIEIWMDIKQKN